MHTETNEEDNNGKCFLLVTVYGHNKESSVTAVTPCFFSAERHVLVLLGCETLRSGQSHNCLQAKMNYRKSETVQNRHGRTRQ